MVGTGSDDTVFGPIGAVNAEICSEMGMVYRRVAVEERDSGVTG